MVEWPTTSTGSQDVARLRQGFEEQVLLPDEDGYHQRGGSGTQLSTGGRRSSRCASPPDVVAAVRFAAERGP